MLVKIAVPQRFQFKMAAGFGDIIFRKPGDTHYIGGTEVLPAPLSLEEEDCSPRKEQQRQQYCEQDGGGHAVVLESEEGGS